MILRGAPIHRDGHGKCGLLSPAFHHGLTPFIAAPLAQQSRHPHVAFRQPSVAVRDTAESHRLVTGLWKKGLACASCERVPYVMDGLGNRGRDHLTGRLVPVFYSDALCETSRPLAHR